MDFARVVMFVCAVLLIAARYPAARRIDVSRARRMTVITVWISLLFVSLVSLKLSETWLWVVFAIAIAAGLVYAAMRSIEGWRLLQTSAPRELILLVNSILWLTPHAGRAELVVYTIFICSLTIFAYLVGLYVASASRKKTVSVQVEYTNLVNHVILYGYCDLTVTVIKALHAAHIPYVIVESDHQKVVKAKMNGFAVVESAQGTAKEFYTYSAMAKAQCLIIFNSGEEIVEQLLLDGKKHNSGLYVVAVADNDAGIHRLKELGADVILRQDFELALSIVKHIAHRHKLKREQVNVLLQKLRFIEGVSA